MWRREIMGDNVGDTEERGVPVSKEFDELPDDVGELQDMLREAKMQLRRVQLELDVRQATLEILKKDPGADPDRLSNAEKAAMVTALATFAKGSSLLNTPPAAPPAAPPGCRCGGRNRCPERSSSGCVCS